MINLAVRYCAPDLPLRSYPNVARNPSRLIQESVLDHTFRAVHESPRRVPRAGSC